MSVGQLLVLRQLLLLGVLAVGAGYWLWRLSGRPSGRSATDFLWLGVAGFCLSALLLQALVYLGVPLRISAWFAFAANATGTFLAVREGAVRIKGRSAGGLILLLVFLGGFLGQTTSLLAVGPSHYFGSGSYDHANYVVTAEFLRSEKFSMRVGELNHHPWLMKALDTKEQRITQCVVLGALAEIDRSSAQECYGSVSAFFVALMAVVTTAWLRSSGMSGGLAAWVGLGAALTPGITRIQLDGFFSQTATLFVYPALAGLLGGREPLTRSAKICAAILLAFLVGTYSEIAIFGFALMAGLVLAQASPWRRRGFDVAAITAGALLLNAGYLGRLSTFLLGQAMFASNPNTLAALFPESGTLLGWGRIFIDLPWSSVVIGAGIAVCALGVKGMAAGEPGDRRNRLIVVGVALLPLLMLRFAPEFPRYPFGKLSVHFIPVWLGIAMIGLNSVAGKSAGFRRFAGMCGCLGALAAFATALPFHREIIRPVGRLKDLSSETLLQSRREAEATPRRSYLVASRDPLMALWLCYFGRKNQVVLESRTLGDRIAPTEAYAFRRWSEPLGPLWWLDPESQGLVKNYEPTPSVRVAGATVTERGELGSIYQVADAVDFIFLRASDGVSERAVWLDFVIVPLSPGQPMELRLEGPAHEVQRAAAAGAGWQRWRVMLPQGESRCRLRVVVPPESPGHGEVILRLLSVEVAPDLLPGDPRPSADSNPN